jgi:phage terminase large subunit
LADLRLSEWVNPQERQKAFLDVFAPADYRKAKSFILYGGAAGGGKSYIARKGLGVFLIHAHQLFGVKNCKVGLFCEDYPALKDRQIGKIKEEFPSSLGELRDDRDLGFGFMFREKYGNGFIALRNLDDPGKYDSAEFAAIVVDEFTKNKQPDLFDQLRKRLRWPQRVTSGNPFPPDFKFPFAACTNPGGPLHGLAKRYWIDRDFPSWLKKHADEFVYIPAKATDNQYNPPAYFEQLMSLEPTLRAAYAEGSWDLFQGQYFGEWREAYHVVEPFEIPKYWKRGIAVDWGWAKPFCCLFFAVSPDGDVYCYFELYGTQRRPEWWAERILSQIERDGLQVADYVRVIDPATFNDEPRFGRPVQEMFSEAGIEFQRANNDRINGWMQVRDYLAWERAESDDSLDLANLIRTPKFYVLRGAAPNLLRTLPVLTSDENNVEDVDTDTEDHVADTLRYYLMSRPRLTKIPFSVLSQEWQEAIVRARYREQNGES